MSNQHKDPTEIPAIEADNISGTLSIKLMFLMKHAEFDVAFH